MTAVLVLPLLADGLNLIAALFRGKVPLEPPAASPRLLVLIPAHDEEALIGECVSSLVGMDYPAELRDIYVVADNCSDRTADLARAAGGRALERSDPDNPGKPRALDWALQQLPVSEYDSVVIIDADTVVDPGFAQALSAHRPLANKAVQAYCAVENPGESALTRMSAVFAAARYEFGFPLKDRARVNVPLMGNGMCIGSNILVTHGWRAYSICEDWELYALVTADGYRIEGSSSARVFAQEARSIKESGSQRQRWAAGKLTVLGRLWRPIVFGRNTGLLQKLDALAELTHFGPAVHLGVVLVLATCTVLVQPPASSWILWGLAASLARLGVYSLLGLTRTPEPWRAARAFLYLPFYMIWRMGVQIQALSLLGDSPWVKTRRND